MDMFFRQTLLRERQPQIDEVQRRWPGVIVLSTKGLDAGHGVAVYFTFPGGKHMSVWISGTDALGVASEDQPFWEQFTARKNLMN